MIIYLGDKGWNIYLNSKLKNLLLTANNESASWLKIPGYSIAFMVTEAWKIYESIFHLSRSALNS